MGNPLLNNNVDTIQKDLMQDLKSSFGELGPALINSKIEQQKVLAESAAEGGPTSPHEVIKNIIEHTKTGMRYLSAEIGVPRKKLLAMIEGKVNIPPEVITAIWNAIDKKNPGELDRLRSLV